MSNLLREIGSNIAKLRALLADSKKDLQRLQTLQKSLEETLDEIWTSSELQQVYRVAPRWKEFVSLVGSGRILAVAAQADEAIDSKSADVGSKSWIADGRKYARWLGRGIATLAVEQRDDVKGSTDLLKKALSLGYTDDIVAALVDALVLSKSRHVTELQSLLTALAAHERRAFLLSTVDFISRRYLSSTAKIHTALTKEEGKVIGGSAALLRTLSSTDQGSLDEILSSWLLKGSKTSSSLYRVVVLAMSDDGQEQALEQIWSRWADKLSIKHTPIMQQDSMTRVLLLLAGRIHKRTPMAVYMHAHSSIHTTGVSARLSSQSPRARFLGMAAGTLISQLVDKPETRMKFDFEATEQDEVDQLNNLLKVNDQFGTIDDLPAANTNPSNTDQVVTIRPKSTKPATSAKPKASKPITKIQVLNDSSSESEDDLPVYAKPDSDPSDSDEDPTVARRNKPKAPVYIRDLITGLNNTEDYDTHYIAMITAPSLIRRKADFGSELSDRAIEICGVYFNLGDPFGLPDFLELRMKGMVAILVAQPKICAPYFADIIFEGDFSIGQRVAGLSAMGLAARELAGYKDGDASDEKQFPSRNLPERLHKLYLEGTEMTALSKNVESDMMAPVSTKRRPQKKVIKNDLSKLVADYFFFPLTGQFAAYYSSLSNLNRILPTLLRTLSIIVTSAGSSTLSLPQITSEFFSLLLSLRSRALNDSSVLEALLFGFLSLLNVNEDKRSLAERHAKEIVECHEWCNAVFDRVSGHAGLKVGDKETERTKTLAAGVLVATKEAVEGYERMIVGQLGGMN